MRVTLILLLVCGIIAAAWALFRSDGHIDRLRATVAIDRSPPAPTWQVVPAPCFDEERLIGEARYVRCSSPAAVATVEGRDAGPVMICTCPRGDAGRL